MWATEAGDGTKQRPHSWAGAREAGRRERRRALGQAMSWAGEEERAGADKAGQASSWSWAQRGEGRFSNTNLFSISSFQILSQNQIKFKYVLNILFISNINEQFW